jgi:hypothetical protein
MLLQSHRCRSSVEDSQKTGVTASSTICRSSAAVIAPEFAAKHGARRSREALQLLERNDLRVPVSGR